MKMFNIAKFPSWLAVLRLAGLLHGCGCHHSPLRPGESRRRRQLPAPGGEPLERLFMSWWAFDPLVGEDKEVGPAEQTGMTFYTSLKFWARKASDIWDFPGFLKYWGWNFCSPSGRPRRRANA